MKKLLVSMMIATMAMSMIAEATARPLGGGRNIGRQSPTAARQATPAPAPAAPAAAAAKPGAAAAAPAAAAAAKPSMWKGMLGGALLGLGLGALFSSMGMGAGLASALSSMLMIGLLVAAAVFIWKMFKRKGQGQSATPAFAGFNQQPAPAPSNVITPAAFAPVAAPAATAAATEAAAPVAAAPWGVPADFDTAGFLRHAKSSFIRMQAAWDKADVNDLREFTTPEVYAELKMQITERGATADFTDVVTIDAELMGIETVGNDYLASVKFNGMIKSAPNAAAEPFAEIWNLSKPLNGSAGWLLAGIQQLS